MHFTELESLIYTILTFAPGAILSGQIYDCVKSGKITPIELIRMLICIISLLIILVIFILRYFQIKIKRYKKEFNNTIKKKDDKYDRAINEKDQAILEYKDTVVRLKDNIDGQLGDKERIRRERNTLRENNINLLIENESLMNGFRSLNFFIKNTKNIERKTITDFTENMQQKMIEEGTSDERK